MRVLSVHPLGALRFSALLAGLLAVHVSAVSARQAAADREFNVYRYVFGHDVPQPSSFLAMGIAASPVPLGSAPKPLAATTHVSVDTDGDAAGAIGLDVSPYYVAAGVRSLASYRSSSLAGRLLRVLTKTVLSFAVADDAGDLPGSRVAVGLRSTFHDPHDPIAPTRLPERVREAFEGAGVPLPPAGEADVRHRGVDVDRHFRDVRRFIRARSGDAQVSGGWGASIRAASGVATSDSLVDTRHLFWLAAQYTAGARLDLLASLQYRDAFGDDDRLWIGAAGRRKHAMADIQAGLFLDTATGDLNPALHVDARLSQQIGMLAGLWFHPDPPDFNGPRRVRFGVSGRWFLATDPWP